MGIELDWHGWSAWAPGLESSADWQVWAQHPQLPVGDAVAAAAQVPPMLRRRLDPLGRAALQVAAEVMGEVEPGISVFVSRRGDSQRSLDLLQSLTDAGGLSPTGFGLSVHNAIAAQHSMWRQQRHAYTALAAGREGVENALVEIAAQLADQPEAVALLVVYEGPVPAPYQAYRDEPDASYAWALRLSAPRRGGRRLKLDWQDAASAEPAADEPLPAALTVLAQLLAGAPSWSRQVDARQWLWTLGD